MHAGPNATPGNPVMSQPHAKFAKRMAEIKDLLKVLGTIDAEFWELIDDEDQLNIIKSVVMSRNFLRDVHSRFEWE